MVSNFSELFIQSWTLLTIDKLPKSKTGTILSNSKSSLIDLNFKNGWILPESRSCTIERRISGPEDNDCSVKLWQLTLARTHSGLWSFRHLPNKNKNHYANESIRSFVIGKNIIDILLLIKIVVYVVWSLSVAK